MGLNRTASVLVGELVACALELDCVITVDQRLRSIALVVTDAGGSYAPVVLRLDGRHLHGPRAAEYVSELCRMMRCSPIVEWPVRAEWIARLQPIFHQLPVGPRAPLQLAAHGAAGPARYALETVVGTFGGVEFPIEQISFGAERRAPSAPMRRVEFTLELTFVPSRAQLLEQALAEMRRTFREATAAVARVRSHAQAHFAEIFGAPMPAATMQAWQEPVALFVAFGTRPSRWRPPVVPLVEQLLRELELEQQLHRLRSYDRGTPSREPQEPESDLAFLARYLSIAGDHARFVADLMLRGGLTIRQLAKIWRDAFEDRAPEDWPS